MEGKYSKVLTAILIVVVIGVVVLIGFLGYDVYEKFATDREASAFLNEYYSVINEEYTDNIADKNVENIGGSFVDIPLLNEELTASNTTTSGGNKKVTYKGYNVIGTIEIPAIDLEYPILEKATTTSIEQAVAYLYGPGPNKIGNTVIVGHNYRNGAFFGNNDKLKVGDKVYIKDNSGTRIQYNIYNIYETSPDDTDYMERDTNGKREISLSTCTDNSQARLIIWAVEE